MARSNASYLDDLLAGKMNIMDERAAKSRRSMVRMSGAASSAVSQSSVSAVSGGASGGGGGGAGADGGRDGRGPASASASGDDLDAFFEAHRSVRAHVGGGRGEATRSSDGFEEIGIMGGSTSSAGSRNARAPNDLDAFFSGLGASGDKAPIGSQSVPVKAPVSKTAGAHARATSGGADLFDFFDVGAREAPKPLIRHERDDSLIDGLDEILGEISIASSPVGKESSEKAESIPSSLSRSASQPLNDVDDLFSSSGEVEGPVGLARFRAPASSSATQNSTSEPARKTRDVVEEDSPRHKTPAPAPTSNQKSFETATAPASAPPAASKPRMASSTASSVEDLDDFFSAGAAKASAPSSKSTVDSLEAMFTVSSGGAAMPTSGVVDDLFGAMDMRAMAHQSGTASSFEYNPDEEIDPNEPPERAALRAARHERNRQRIEQALKEKRARESAARQEQAERQMLKDLIGADIDMWQKKNQNNIRTMLANLGDVLWEGHRYKAPDMATLMQPIGVKKSYHKALVIIHPDKVSQSGGDMSQRYIADKVFDIMKVAYKEFEAKELAG